jgi:hypothetical protein
MSAHNPSLNITVASGIEFHSCELMRVDSSYQETLKVGVGMVRLPTTIPKIPLALHYQRKWDFLCFQDLNQFGALPFCRDVNSENFSLSVPLYSLSPRTLAFFQPAARE